MLRNSFRRAIALTALGVLLPCTAGAATVQSLRPGGTPVDGGYLVLAGSLHDHSYDSDGHDTGEHIAAWEQANRYALGLDFGSLTEHSDTFPFGSNSSVDDENVNTNQIADLVWPHQATIDATYSIPGQFTFLRGFEYTSDQENHLNVIGSQNWATPEVINGQVDENMAIFYTWLRTKPTPDSAGLGLGYGGSDGIGQFNHPDSKGALNWDDYAFDWGASPFMNTIEIFGSQCSNANCLAQSDGGWYWFALTKGWTVGPTMDWDNHYWSNLIAQPNPGGGCGVTNYLPCERTLVFAAQNTQAAILDALRHSRTNATQYPGLWASLRGPGGTYMGDTVAAAAGSRLTMTLTAGSDVFPLQSVDIVSDNSVNPFPYYYGDNLACNATPIPYGGNLNPNCLPEEIGETSLAPSYILQHEKYVSTGGHATRKAIIDQPPSGTTVASIPLSGNKKTVTFTVTVPTALSLRPDYKHFFYAVVHAGGFRTWTAPIFTLDCENENIQTQLRMRHRATNQIRRV